MGGLIFFFSFRSQHIIHVTTTFHNCDSPSPGPLWSAQITNQLPHKRRRIWQHDLYFWWVDLWHLSRTDLPKTQRISALLLCGGQRTSEQQDVWLWLVDHVMHPSLALLDPQVPPLGLWHQMGLGHTLCNFLGQHYMSVLIFVIVIFIRVVDMFLRHDETLFKSHDTLLRKETTFAVFRVLQ